MARIETGMKNYYFLGSMDLSSGKKAYTFRVPHFQRPYKWTDDHIEKLIADSSEYLLKNEGGNYFSGAMVTVKNTNKSEEEYALIDGQQRYTTAFLSNFLLFLLLRSYFDYGVLNGRESACFSSRQVLLKDATQFLLQKVLLKNLDKEIEDLISTDEKTREDNIVKYRTIFRLPAPTTDSEQFLTEHKNQLKDLLKNYKLRLVYARDSLNQHILEALSRISVVGIGQSKPEINIYPELNREEVETQVGAYINAARVLFKKQSEKISEKEPIKYTEKLISLFSEFLERIEYCEISTKKENDAYTLFEVLNTRGLALEPLDLIKNNFYKIYASCNEKNSKEVDETINKMEVVWSDEVFSDDIPDYKKNLIAYLGIVYITGSKELKNEQGKPLRDAIEKHLKALDSYSSEDITTDFEIFAKIKEIINTTGLKYRDSKNNLIQHLIIDKDLSKCSNAILLAYSLNMPAVIPAITNSILCYYYTEKPKGLIPNITNKSTEPKELKELGQYIVELLLGSKDYEKPRKAARDIIGGRNKQTKKYEKFSFEDEHVNDSDFINWTASCKYNDGNILKIRILILNLISATKDPQGNLDFNAPFSNIPNDPKKLNLDHMEPQKIDNHNAEKYFGVDDIERDRVVNEIGNLMILGSAQNVSKSNKPFTVVFESLKSTGLGSSWMVSEIQSFYDKNKNASGAPVKSFFDARKKALQKDMLMALKHRD